MDWERLRVRRWWDIRFHRQEGSWRKDLLLWWKDQGVEVAIAPKQMPVRLSRVSLGKYYCRILSPQLHSEISTMAIHGEEVEADKKYDDANHYCWYDIDYSCHNDKYNGVGWKTQMGACSSTSLLVSSNLRYLKWSNLPRFVGMYCPWPYCNR